MQRSLTRIRWHEPLQPGAEGRARAFADVASVAGDRDLLSEMVLRAGIPIVEGATTAREYAIGLLKLAAEVEHALMVQYLYAAVSVPDELSSDSIDYHRKILNIAIQEMGHLATLQNLLLLLGGRDGFYVQRDIIREASDKNPLPFVLEPISKTSLAKYVSAEKPARVPPQFAAKVNELVKLAKEDAGIEPHRVGAIYELLRWIFLSPEEAAKEINYATLAPLPKNPHISDKDVTDPMEIARFEALRTEWGVSSKPGVILAAAHNRAEALAVLDQIARQGEGLPDTEHSHFSQFMEIVIAFEAGIITVTPMAKSPTVGEHGGIGGAMILHPYTRLWGEVFSLQYGLLVLTIYHSLITARPSDESKGLRGALSSLAVRGMRTVITPLSVLLASLSMRADGTGGNAGPPFDLDPSILQSSNDQELTAHHLRMLKQLASSYGAIELSPDFGAQPDHANMLTNLRNFDERRRKLFVSPAPPVG